MALSTDYLHLGLALAIGLLIGLERGWTERTAPEGSRVAGLRTIGLIGLIGGTLGLLAARHGAIVLAGGLLAVAIPLSVGYWLDARRDSDISATTVIAALAAFGLGALATSGYPRLSVSAAVIAALLLNLKPVLHSALLRIEPIEMKAVLRFLLISVVLLPLLPNKGYGPHEALNPYLIWWMVVLVSGISFAGYIAVRLWGERRGLLLTAAVGALVSSTAIAFAFGREARKHRDAARLLSSGIILASSIMVLRIFALSMVIAPTLLPDLVPLLTPIAVTGFLGSLLLAPVREKDRTTRPDYRLENPFEMKVALFFGIGLGLVMLAARVIESRFGAGGLFGVAVATGLFDVDAMTVSAGQMAHDGLAQKTAAAAIAIAALANSLSKAVIGITVGGSAIARHLAAAFGAMIAAGVVALILTA
ncbi:MAG: MgtC/SapB family protein [Rhodothalassiaceae bacterium]